VSEEIEGYAKAGAAGLDEGIQRVREGLDRIERMERNFAGIGDEATRPKEPTKDVQNETREESMPEENRREIKIPGGVARLAEDAMTEDAPAPETQRRILSETERSIAEREKRERAGKISLDELQRQRGEKEIEEFRKRELALWKARGGTLEEFRAEWPRIKADHIRRENEERGRNFSSVY
jgi:hypothetical protein